MSSAPQHAYLWIGGEARPSSTNKTFDVVNAITQTVVTKAFAASSEDANAAIEAADSVQAAWEASPWRIKRELFLKAAQLIQSPKYVERIRNALAGEISSLESGVQVEVMGAVSHIMEAAVQATQLTGETLPSARAPGGTVLIERRALGTVFAIAPYNGPCALTVRAVAIPLICGNAVVLKSSELSPRASEIIVDLFYEAGLPKGILSLIHVAREDAPKIVADIISHRLIKHINFTGSDRVGKVLAGEAAKYLKPCVLELGGKSAVVVLNDADVERAARFIIFSSMAHAGQICMSTERVIVQSTISKPLIDTLISLAHKLRPTPSSPSSDTPSDTPHIPPLASRIFIDPLYSLLKDATSRGAQLLVGDLTAPPPNSSAVKPHILLGVEPGWPIWERETFGPVFGIKIVADGEIGEKEAVELANKTDYSLMGAVWTEDWKKGMKLGRKIRAGYVHINGPTFGSEPGICIRGLGGATGYGTFDVENFTQKRVLILNPDDLPLPTFGDL